MTEYEPAERSPRSPLTIYLRPAVARACLDEVTRWYPLESGGAFMGWWANATTLIVEHAIGAGPAATHTKNSFEPDHAWQQEQIRHVYERFERRCQYVGDWHSHPNSAKGGLSWSDRLALRSICNAPSARCPKPIMVIWRGTPDKWTPIGWFGELGVGVGRIRRLVVTHAQVLALD